MGLSSNIVWHQTSFNGIKAILENMAFYVSYSLETIKSKGTKYNIAFPMISFCDIPFSDMSEYLTENKGDKLIGKYGKYTIGLKRSWANKMGMSPVWYRDNNSIALHNNIKAYRDLKKNFNKDESSRELNIYYTLAFTKNIQGRLIKYGFESYRFLDEKEVRFIPKYENIIEKNKRPYIKADSYEKFKKDMKSTLIPELKCPFTEEDIVYILCSNKNMRKNIRQLLNIKGEHILILSYDQVIQDIIGERHFRKF